ncbi:MAG: gamma-glutamyl hercynylcysteine S-oxide synthase, partial [Mycobacterium sp.]|nr:gamma-glutamyl hercynylcysteine S-oxide synthase [Mycobacterium sp.]
MSTRELLARELTRTRERTLRLVDFDDAELFRQYDPLMSPLVWDLAHIGWQEELWLLRGNDPGRAGMLEPQLERCYDAFLNSRASRVDLPLLNPSEARSYCATVREPSGTVARSWHIERDLTDYSALFNITQNGRVDLGNL